MQRRSLRNAGAKSPCNSDPLSSIPLRKKTKVLRPVQPDNEEEGSTISPNTNDKMVTETSNTEHTRCSSANSNNSNQENKDCGGVVPESHVECLELSERQTVDRSSPLTSVSAEDEVAPVRPNLTTMLSDVVSKHMRDEEDKLHKISAAREELETKTFLQEWEQAEEEEKEERYQKLQLLLTKSELYTKYLLERMEQQKQMMMDSNQENDDAKGDGPPVKKQRRSKKATDSQSQESVQLSQDSQTSKTSEAEMALCNGCPLLFTGDLRPYQVDGLIWLNTMFENGVNGILADEMGLGKTVQCIAAIAHLVTMNIRGPFLIVVPLSTLPNWVNEFKRFAPKVPTVLYHGTKAEREVLRAGMFAPVEVDGQWTTLPVICTSYEVAMMDSKFLMSKNWKYLIVDEGHRIKNSQCRLIKELRLYDSTHRVLLTGTPLQNNLSELWTLLNFLLPEVFDDLETFEYWFQLDCLRNDQQDQLVAEEKKRNILAMLHKIMTPFILRRLKSDVELNLPPKQELLVYAPLTNAQTVFYKATIDKTISHLLKTDEEKEEKAESEVGDKEGARPKRRSTQGGKIDYTSQIEMRKDGDIDDDIDDWVEQISELTSKRSNSFGVPKKRKLSSHVHNIKLQNPMMQLRRCCSHPYLLSQPINPETGYCIIDENVVSSSGKMLLLDAMLTELKRTGHKVLIFSQMTKMLNIIEDFCYIRQHQYCRLDGSTNINDRREQMELFNTDPDYFLFLLSTRAGGLGINLCSADTVIIFDSDWNPQCDLQAQDRAHRIGQTKPVMVYRLVCANTIEERVVERASRKRRLEKMVIHKEKFKTGMTKSYMETCKSITPEELMELLKSHDHDAIIPTTNRKEVISKRNLHALLDRSHLIEEWEANMSKAKAADAGQEKKITKKSRTASPGLSRVFKVVDG